MSFNTSGNTPGPPPESPKGPTSKKRPIGLHSRTIIHASFWIAGMTVALCGVLFEHLVASIQKFYFQFLSQYPYLFLVLTPILFVLATALVVYFAPQARGSGIPQAMKATMMSLGSTQTVLSSGLVSIRTAIVKVLSTGVGLAAGASIGREGPTVQISTALFAWLGSKTKKVFPHTDFHSYLVAGSAAGVAAAFNTPLAGISFAIEEMASGSFSQIKQTVMLSVIIAGISAQMLVGNYIYFGHPNVATPGIDIAIPAILIGIVGGVLGGFFAKALAYPSIRLLKLKWWKTALVCGILCAVINFLSQGQSAGTGYDITREFMNSKEGSLSYFFPIAKFFTSVFSFLSGMAGGIFSPSLAIGAGVGNAVAMIGDFEQVKICALLGMVAFFTGVIHAPLTGVIIIMEMTDVHELILPLMISAFVAQGISKWIMPKSIYQFLAYERPERFKR